jgi:hypothetical protein
MMEVATMGDEVTKSRPNFRVVGKDSPLGSAGNLGQISSP